ncbi:nucleotide-diphospho-sugar transferase [Nadsonia fulvescens var. elongata DSM 6958]|uniref:Translation initiation factor eIF2B subunit gamma n=1 Tax=Nadsonia fulvescens var. elongata DSM 6958 TaxID=857566 RepID=A0A1E3PQR9_9ASCO|nr:nucleotide-diphospho-sugar transferase [Nadsonia fulvescens var. elongata DSM 6958]
MEFHAIILCGQGGKLSPLSSVRQSGIAKALLPVANKPLIGYSLEWCEKVGFPAVTIVTSSSSAPSVSQFVDSFKKTTTLKSVNILGTDAKFSGDIVLSLAPEIKSDFIVLPCDFITDISPQLLVEVHRNRDPNSLITGIYYNNNLENIEKKSLLSDYLVHTPLSNNNPRLLDAYSREAVSSARTFQLRTSMLWKHSNSIISSKILESSIYFCSGDVLKLLTTKSKYEEEQDSRELEHDNFDMDDDEVKNSELISQPKIYAVDKPWKKIVRDMARRSWKHSTPYQSVGFYLIKDENQTFIRANSLSAYMEANRWVMKQQVRLDATAPKPAATTKTAATIGNDSSVADDAEIGERTSIKKSIVGKACKLGKKCRITGCVILDGVVIGDEVHLENCIIGTKAVLETRVKLTGCNVEGTYIVPKGTQAKNETLVVLSLEGLNEDGEPIYDEEFETDSEDGESSDYSDEEFEDDYMEDGDDLFDRD